MDLALALLLLWGLLFMPLGIALHWIVLGTGARVRALPLAPVTGIAAAIVVLAALGRFDVEAGESLVAVGFLVASIASAVAIWRSGAAWRSRELIGAGVMLLFAVILLQMPVIGEPGEGPLGYGTVANPVDEVAAIDAAADGPASELEIALDARDTADERPIGFEQFAALTVGIGLDDEGERDVDQTWTAYGLHSTITGMLAALVTLPLFAFARARGVRWFGLAVLVPLGVLAPAVFLALANGQGAAVASVPFTTAAVFSLLVTRRDRGWWALVVLFGSAIAVTAGPLALLPLVVIGITWMFVRSDTYEHLSQHDSPVARARTLVVTSAAAVLGVLGSLPLLLGSGQLLAWQPLHSTLLGAVRSWPYAWLDSDLSTAGPRGTLETAIWLIGPALLVVALIYAVVRNERRELGVLAGTVLAAAIAASIGLFNERAGIRLFEFVMLSTSPFLAALAIRAVALARENADELRGTREGRLAGIGPTLLVVVFVLLSFAATAVTGTRMVHAPAIAGGIGPDGLPSTLPTRVQDRAAADRTTLIAAGDPWLEFVVDGERVRGGYADADAISEPRNEYSEFGTRGEGYDQLILSSSPLSSDPSLRYLEQSDLDAYQVRLFRDRTIDDPPSPDPNVDTARRDQRARTRTADRPGAETDAASGSGTATADPAGDAAAEARAAAEDTGVRTFFVSERHIPVEGPGENTPPDRPAGLLLPASDVPGCGDTREQVLATTCEPDEPLVDGTDCTREDVAAARSPIDRDRRSKRSGGTARPQVLSIAADENLPRRPPLIGVQCFDVPLDPDSGVLQLHLRDVGLILAPEDAAKGGPAGAWDVERERGREGGSGGVNGGTRLTTSDIKATLGYGGGRLSGAYDLVLEGEFGAGVTLGSEAVQVTGPEGAFEGIAPLEIARFRGSADGFSQIRRNATLTGGVTVANPAGTAIELGRLFARPRDIPPSCDVLVALAEDEQREIRMDVAASDGGPSRVRPGITVTVVSITGSGSNRVARIAVGTYLSKHGLPRHMLVDWTEQFPGETPVEGCDGIPFIEEGAAPPGSDSSATAVELESALGADDDH